MDVERLIRDLEACLADCEWERAEVYFSDLRTAAEEAARALSQPRLAGAIAHTLLGVERALERHDGRVAATALRHLAYLVGGTDDASGRAAGDRGSAR